MTERLTYTYRETAEALGVHPDTIRAMVARGDLARLPHVGRRLLIAKVELDRFVRSGVSRKKAS